LIRRPARAKRTLDKLEMSSNGAKRTFLVDTIPR
jgi:hypothetical protein